MSKSITIPKQLNSPEVLFEHLEIGKGEAKFLMTGSGLRYHQVSIPKRRTGHRILLIPDDRLKFHQRKILSLLEQLFVVRNPVHAFVKERSQITNANEHQGRPHLLNLDLRDFFPTISVRRVAAMLKRIGVPSDTVQALVALTMTQNQLPQGAPTSPVLSNMVCFKMDRELMQFAGRHHLRYTRYADDISFSGFRSPHELFDGAVPATGPVATERIAPLLRSIVDRNGFVIHERKIWFSDKQGRKDVTGLTVNKFTNIPRPYIRNLRASLYKIETMGLAAAQTDFRSRYASKSQLEEVLRGRLLWVAQVRGHSFSAYRTLAKRFNKLFPKSPLRIEAAAQDLIDRATWVLEWCEDTAKGVVAQQGTAMFVRDIGLVTAHHVVENLPAGSRVEIFHPTNPKKKYKAWPSANTCSVRDLCVLHHKIPKSAWLDLPISTAADRKGDQIQAVGFPEFEDGSQLTQISGEIVMRAQRHAVSIIDVTALINSGMSGGAILNSRTEIVGFGIKGGISESRQIAVAANELIKMCEA